MNCVNAQEVRFSLQFGTAIPLGSFAEDKSCPENGGFAKTGFDMKFVAERVFENHFVTGVNVGFSMFGIDQDALKKYINPTNPELVRTETQAFQNINLQFRGGYDWNVKETNFHVTPFVDAGLGIFNSAYYAISNDGGDTYLRTGSTGLGFLISPGLDLTYMVNDFVGIKLYSNYQFAQYKVDEEFRVVSGTPDVIDQQTKKYNYSSVCLGLGANVTL